MDVVASVLAATVMGSAALSAQSPARVGAVVADPADGPPWAVRTFERDGDGGAREVCLQVGRLIDGALFRVWTDGRRREMVLGDRSVCGRVEPFAPDLLPVSVERLVDDPRSADPRPIRTIVAGLAPVDGPVRLRVGASVLRLPVDPATRTYLAVLAGTVRRADLTLRVPSEKRTHVLDFAGRNVVEFTAEDRYRVGSARRVLALDDPAGGRRVGLVAYARTVATIAGPRRQQCVEIGRVLGTETGLYQPAWGSFLDAPTLVSLHAPQDDWLPVAPPAAAIDSCTIAAPNVRKPPLQAFGIQRLDPHHVAMHGILARGAHVAVPASRRRLRIDRSTRAFLAIVPSTGRRGERRRLVVIGPGGRRHAYSVALGPQEWPRALDTAARRRQGRVLRVRWVGGFEPLAAIRVVTRPTRTIVKVSELAPPRFAPDGAPIGIAAIAIDKCLDIRLRKPVGRRTIVDAVTKRALHAPRRASAPSSCPTVDANRRFDPPIDLTRGGAAHRRRGEPHDA